MRRRGSAFLIISTLLVIMIVVAISVGSVSVPLEIWTLRRFSFPMAISH